MSATQREMAGLWDGRRHVDRITEERDAWIRLFNRLEASISHHKKAKSGMFVDDADEALYAARDRVLKAAAEGNR